MSMIFFIAFSYSIVKYGVQMQLYRPMGLSSFAQLQCTIFWRFCQCFL